MRRVNQMAKNHKLDEIITKMFQAETMLVNGAALPDVAREIGITERTYYRWRRDYGLLQEHQSRRLKELEIENARLRRAVSDLMLNKLTLHYAEREEN